MWSALQELPEFTREEFEKGEKAHWTNHFIKQARREYLATGRVSAGILEEFEKLGTSPEQIVLDIKNTVDKNVLQIEKKAKELKSDTM